MDGKYFGINLKVKVDTSYYCSIPLLRTRSVKDQSSIKKVSRSIKNLPSASTHFEDPCRRFVFAPACRGVTSKRSNEFGKTPELSFPVESYEESSPENLREDGEVSNQIP